MCQLTWNNNGRKLAARNNNVLLGIEFELPDTLRQGEWTPGSLGTANFSSRAQASHNNIKVVV